MNYFPVKTIITKLDLTTNKSTTEVTVVKDVKEHREFMKQFDHCEDSSELGTLYNNDNIGVDSLYDKDNNVIYHCVAVFNCQIIKDMTKCIVLGEGNEESKKGIEFTSCVNASTQCFDDVGTEPRDWDNIELVLHSDIDIMFAYDTDRRNGCLYLGHWNDGVV